MYPFSKVIHAILLLNLLICNLFLESFSAKNQISSMAENVLDFMESSFVNPRRQLSMMSFSLEDKTVYKFSLQILAATMMRVQGEKRRSYYSKVQPVDMQTNINGRPIMLNRNIVAIVRSSNSSNWSKYLELMTKCEVNRAILVFVGYFGVDEERILNEEIQKISKNSMFYLTYESKQKQSFLWKHVISVQGYKQKVQNVLQFDSRGKLMVKNDLQALHIEAMTATWEPYLKLYECNEEQTKCKSEGYLTDVMDIMGKLMNFTWEAHGRKDNNWGVSILPVSSNSSRMWGGIAGDIVYGDYPICVR